MAGKFENQSDVNLLKSVGSFLLAIAIMLGTYWLSTLPKDTFGKATQESAETLRPNVTEANSPRPETNINSARHTDTEAWVCAKAIVQDNLKSPSTAKFCSFTEASIRHIGNGEYIVAGWVDAQNGFGATVREDFVVTYTATTSGFKNGNVIFS